MYRENAKGRDKYRREHFDFMPDRGTTDAIFTVSGLFGLMMGIEGNRQDYIMLNIDVEKV